MVDLKDPLHKLRSGDALSRQEAQEVMADITSGLVDEVQTSALIAAYMMRRPTVDELSGFRSALMERCLHLTLTSERPAIDIVGTGGDGKDTFNISTLASVVVSAAGYPVIKHGNYAASSVSGASNVLQSLGYRFSNQEEALQRRLDTTGFCYLHAPMFHQAMRYVGSVRQKIGLRTFFNLLGPLTNPAAPHYLLTGTSTLAVCRMYHYFLQSSTMDYFVVHDLNGYDEVSLTETVKVYGRQYEALLTPSNFGSHMISQDSLSGGGSVEHSSRRFMAILEDKSLDQERRVVAANAGIALYLMDNRQSLADHTAHSYEIINSGKALKHLHHIINSAV